MNVAMRSFDDLTKYVLGRKPRVSMAVAAAEDEHVLQAVCAAAEREVVEPVLIGSAAKIKALLSKIGEVPGAYDIIDSASLDESAERAVSLVSNGKASVLMKGQLNTSVIFKAAFNKECGISTGRRVSQISINEVPGHGKPFIVTDSGINILPDLSTKKDMLLNAVGVMHSLGVAEPMVAVLAALEVVNPKMPDTVDAAELKRMNKEGIITGCIVEGPISLDIAADPEAAAIKGFSSPVVGNTDIYLAPDLTCANVFNKTLRCYAGSLQIGMAVGLKAPVVLTSRGTTAGSKYLSVLFSAAMVM